MDTALKQRLVGASVIIALAVIFIPMIFNDSNLSQNKSISIKIPEEPSNLKQKVLSIDSYNLSENDETEENSITENHSKENSAPINKQESILEVVDNSVKPTQDIIANDENINSDVPKIKSEPQKQGKQPIIETNSDSIMEPIIDQVETKNSYRIKLGSFSSQKNAQQLKAQIIHNGYKAVVENDETTDLFKVFSNQLNSLKEAIELNSKIQKLNLNIGKSSIEKLDGNAQNKAELQLDSGWILQIGSFSSKENSLKLRDKIRNKGFVSFVDEIFNSKKQLRYRVRIGPYATREEALTEKTKIKNSMNLKSLIKPHEKQKVINR